MHLHAAVDDHAALVTAIVRRTVIAYAIDLLVLQSADLGWANVTFESSARSRWIRWSGWSVAAAVALMWIGMSQFTPTSNRSGTSNIQPASLTASEARSRYVEAGKAEGILLQELPKVLIRTQQSSDGKETEVVYLRQFVERTTPSAFYGVERDESDVPRVVPVKWTNPSTGELY
jgi:hypothetical protein